jgi:uncharacterized protein DUF4158
MKQDWHLEELALHWTLCESELELLGTKTGATRLSFAILLKTFQFFGRFPDRREDVAGGIVSYLASQTGVPPEAYFDGEWSERGHESGGHAELSRGNHTSDPHRRPATATASEGMRPTYCSPQIFSRQHGFGRFYLKGKRRALTCLQIANGAIARLCG